MKTVSLRLVVAALLAGIGLTALVVGSTYDLGSARRMGPGYFPVVLSAVLVLLALAEGVSAIVKRDPENPSSKVDWRPLLAILSAVAGFAITIAFFGLIPAFFVVIGLSTLSERGYGWKPAVILSIITCIGAWLLFSQLLGMALPLFRLGL
ncbi:tripartite tricarboxylate transporter TctB family protein [Roseibium marinum]|uniref:Tripartite tricarboxylate transporter TctB family protein n=1 Tax=Roseibium marinum TaxID=281252 RepID=A0A2S3UWU2_9HYPH|nr:tripartite tricarboxylate transporter TctB family protein [Roseibium marinum]POF32188.1 tripartite tricarboxylate transporter TctB family protein [Roseibium marinum]